MRLNSSDLSLLNCSICQIIKRGKTFQCSNGHIVCDECLENMVRMGRRECCVCREIMPRKPCRSLIHEQICRSSLVKLTCKYETHGCDKLMKANKLEEHEKECRFRTLQCPFGQGCKDEVPFNQLKQHLTQDSLRHANCLLDTIHCDQMPSSDRNAITVEWPLKQSNGRITGSSDLFQVIEVNGCTRMFVIWSSFEPDGLYTWIWTLEENQQQNADKISVKASANSDTLSVSKNFHIHGCQDDAESIKRGHECFFLPPKHIDEIKTSVINEKVPVSYVITRK